MLDSSDKPRFFTYNKATVIKTKVDIPNFRKAIIYKFSFQCFLF